MDIILPLSKNFSKPHFRWSINDSNILVLFDTGADISVWCGKPELFFTMFNGAELMKKDEVIKGFGGPGEHYDLYKVPELKIGTSVSICIHNHFIAVGPNREFTASLILSSNTLRKCDYEIRNTKNELVIHANRKDYYMTLHEDGSTGVFSARMAGYNGMKDSLRGMF